MTVRIDNPAVNLREEFNSLRNQANNEDTKFYLDLVLNGDFSSGIEGWSGTGAEWDSSGYLKLTSTNSLVSQEVSTVPGRLYRLDALGVAYPSQCFLFVGTTLGGNQVVNVSSPASNFTTTFRATTNSVYIGVAIAAAQPALWDNIALHEIDDDANIIQSIPYGYSVKDVYIDGKLAVEGVYEDYQVKTSGTSQWLVQTIDPTASTETCVIGVRK